MLILGFCRLIAVTHLDAQHKFMRYLQFHKMCNLYRPKWGWCASDSVVTALTFDF